MRLEKVPDYPNQYGWLCDQCEEAGFYPAPEQARSESLKHILDNHPIGEKENDTTLSRQ